MADKTYLFDFDDREPFREPFKFRGKDYILTEASADAARRYRNVIIGAARFQDGKPTSVTGMADAETLLVAACVLEEYEDGGQVKTRPMTELQIRGWPSRVTKPLFDKIKQVSELDDREDEPTLVRRLEETQRKLDELRGGVDHAKNGQAATTDTTASQATSA